jgi:hypothetical protein
MPSLKINYLAIKYPSNCESWARATDKQKLGLGIRPLRLLRIKIVVNIASILLFSLKILVTSAGLEPFFLLRGTALLPYSVLGVGVTSSLSSSFLAGSALPPAVRLCRETRNKLPFLDKEGRAGATPRPGGLIGGGKRKLVAGLQQLAPPRGRGAPHSLLVRRGFFFSPPLSRQKLATDHCSLLMTALQ